MKKNNNLHEKHITELYAWYSEERMKKFFRYLAVKFNKFLEKMAAENQKMYGTKGPSCCDMNRKSATHKN
jgi:hypothetical protein